MPDQCEWKFDKSSDYYETSCEGTFCFTDDKGLKDADFKYCPYCGLEIEEAPND